MRKERKRNILIFSALALAAAILFVADIVLGSVNIPFGDVWDALTRSGTADPATDVNRTIVLNFRLPRALVAVIAGASLSAAGLQMQTLFRNPLAGPYVLGISSGASLGVAIFIMGLPLLGLSAAGDVVRNLGAAGAAWIGSAAILLIISAVSTRLKDIMAILILGIMFGSVATAFVEILQYVSPEGMVKSFVVWTMGSLGGVSSAQLAILVPVSLAGLALSVALIKPLDMLLLGENYARTMGLNVRLTRAMIFLSTTLLAGTVTAFCGPLGFIGIAVPHVARMIFARADHKILMPASMLAGATLMLLCDIVAQMPGREITLPINTITALLGIPVVIMVIVRNRKIF